MPDTALEPTAAPLLRAGAARVVAHGNRSAPPACRSCGAGRGRRESLESFRGCGSALNG